MAEDTIAAAPPATADLLESVFADLANVVAGVPSTAEIGPTPCTEFSVHALRDHIVRWLTMFAAGFSADDGRCPDPRTLRISGTDAEVRAAADAIVDSLRAAARGDAGDSHHSTVTITSNPMPKEMAAKLILGEYVVHGWDLATATGQEWSPPEEAIAESSRFFGGMLKPEFRGVGKSFGIEVDVPADATPLDRLIAQAGRDPQWRPSGPPTVG
jgi:uncharacterized protein (TIGR03086 family)